MLVGLFREPIPQPLQIVVSRGVNFGRAVDIVQTARRRESRRQSTRRREERPAYRRAPSMRRLSGLVVDDRGHGNSAAKGFVPHTCMPSGGTCRRTRQDLEKEQVTGSDRSDPAGTWGAVGQYAGEASRRTFKLEQAHVKGQFTFGRLPSTHTCNPWMEPSKIGMLPRSTWNARGPSTRKHCTGHSHALADGVTSPFSPCILQALIRNGGPTRREA